MGIVSHYGIRRFHVVAKQPASANQDGRCGQVTTGSCEHRHAQKKQGSRPAGKRLPLIGDRWNLAYVISSSLRPVTTHPFALRVSCNSSSSYQFAGARSGCIIMLTVTVAVAPVKLGTPKMTIPLTSSNRQIWFRQVCLTGPVTSGSPVAAAVACRCAVIASESAHRFVPGVHSLSPRVIISRGPTVVRR